MRLVPLSLVAGALALASCRPAAKPVPAATPTRPGANAGAPGQQTPGQPTPGQPGGAQPGGLPGGIPGAGAGEPNPRPYATVITPRAKSKTGVFGVHQVGSRLFFEIPASEMGKDFVVTQVLAATPNGIPGLGTWFPGTDRVIRFERRDNRVLMRNVNYNDVATDTTLITPLAMQMIQFYPVMAAYNVEAYGKDSAAVIDVTRMFTGGIADFTAGGRRVQVDATRSFIERISAFDRNVNITASQTYTPPAGANPLAALGLGGGAPSATTEAYAFSIVKLPDNPMQPRLWDARVGFFDESKTEYGSPEQRIMPRTYITRWRLECGDQRVGNLCVPRKPITYYIDPATPKWLVPWVKAGVEEWQSAFEDAGFSKGIVAKDAPTNDPDFSGEDASVSMVRWLATPVQNAVGPSTIDPRTGEIIDADVQMFHNIMDLQRNWYFTQVGHLDKRAQKFPFPDSLMGRLVQFVVAHEVGHTLGFPHNFKGSSMYPLDSIRSKSWVARMGHSPSIMDYARFNYVAQPEDNIPLADLVPKVGPYDKFAVMWGYKPIPGARTPEAERKTLDEWARMQDKTPWFRFANDGGAGGADPAEQSEAIGDADAVRATRYGFKNIARIMKLVEPAATADPTADFSLLRATYAAVVNQWATEAAHVARVVGASDKQEKAVSQGGVVWTPVSKTRQRDAVRFLNDEVFATPQYLIETGVLRRFESDGNINRLTSAQGRALNALLSNQKLQRMVEMEATASNKSQAYTVGEMLTDLRRGLWSEIYSGKPIDAYRRRLQAVYLEQMATKIRPPAAAANNPLAALLGVGGGNSRDFRPLVKDEMRVLDRELASAISRTSDRTSRAHLMDARDQIKEMLKTGSDD
jgi:hypothetical protein